jgi:hypothetical protein
MQEANTEIQIQNVRSQPIFEYFGHVLRFVHAITCKFHHTNNSMIRPLWAREKKQKYGPLRYHWPTERCGDLHGRYVRNFRLGRKLAGEAYCPRLVDYNRLGIVATQRCVDCQVLEAPSGRLWFRIHQPLQITGLADSHFDLMDNRPKLSRDKPTMIMVSWDALSWRLASFSPSMPFSAPRARDRRGKKRLEVCSGRSEVSTSPALGGPPQALSLRMGCDPLGG